MASAGAFSDLFQGGIGNLSRHTRLPQLLLEDLSFNRGEATEFFAAGPLRGTPLRTLPARIKPLVALDGEFYATDPAFVRDSGYRSLQRGLLRRAPHYREEWNALQKQMSETAFSCIFAKQLDRAKVDREIWYRDTNTRQWVENDTLIRIDDALLLVEAKAGAAATIESPALDFDRHVRAVQELVTKAYAQCRRFFEYLSSSAEVSVFKRGSGRYVEFDRLRVADYRIMFPVGLTVESFSPFSSMCKELTAIEPILGDHPFVSMSIDDLFVLTRFLPTAGELMHYLEVRQSVAGIRGGRLYDEMDHLGAYIADNRFDQTMREQLLKADLIMWDGFSEKVDSYFMQDRWLSQEPPRQPYPAEVQAILRALDSTKAAGWLGAESHIRNYGAEGRENLASWLGSTKRSLGIHSMRWFVLGDAPPLFVWLQRTLTELTPTQLRREPRQRLSRWGRNRSWQYWRM